MPHSLSNRALCALCKGRFETCPYSKPETRDPKPFPPYVDSSQDVAIQYAKFRARRKPWPIYMPYPKHRN